MTSALFFRSQSGRMQGFLLLGHAGYASRGRDIVCAAVSALCITATNALEAVAGVENLRVIQRPGILHVRLPVHCESDKAQVILQTLLLGLQQVAEGHPSHLSIKERRCKPCFK